MEDHVYEKIAASPDPENSSDEELWQGGDEWLHQDVSSVSRLYLLFLTMSMGGLQVVWATVMAEGSTFLLSLGLQTWLVSLVWLAGPISGTLLQPYLGYKSDFCAHPWGRRRPFMIYGTLATVACINLLAWTSESVKLVCYFLGVQADGIAAQFITQALAVVWIWALNIAIQPVQTSIRALIVDSCPGNQAVQANSYASTAVIIGSAIGYGCGFINMPNGGPLLKNTQFKGLCLIASVSLGLTVTITSTMIEEKDVELNGYSTNIEKFVVRGVWLEIYKAIRTLPPTIRKVCVVQFFSWLAWFPFLFNIVIYLSKIYGYQILSEKMGPSSTRYYKAVRLQSTQHAVLAMLVFSIVALIANLLIPCLITTPHSLNWQQARKSTKKQLLSLTLSRAWMCSHVLTAVCLFGATLGDGFMTAVFFVSLLGISWALTQWAPFAIITAEIAKNAHPKSNMKEELLRSESSSSASPIESRAGSDEGESLTGGLDGLGIRSRAGTTMGVHNIAIAMPQMLSAVISSFIFWGCKHLNIGEKDAMAWVLRVGIIAALCAAYSARHLS